MKRDKQKGSGSIAAVLGIATLLGVGFVSLQHTTNQHFVSQERNYRKTETYQRNVTSLGIFSDGLALPARNSPPLVFLDPYPLDPEMPVHLGVFGNGSISLLSPSSVRVNLPNLNELSAEEYNTLLSSPGLPIPSVSQNVAEMRVLGVERHPTNAALVLNLLVESVSQFREPTARGNQGVVRNIARVELPVPPAPNCELIAAGSGPFHVGTQVSFQVRADSIVAFASVEGAVATLLPQRISSVAAMTDAISPVNVTVPEHPVPGTPMDPGNGSVPWQVVAEVRGVDGTLSSCATTVPVVVPPRCTLTANPPQVAAGQNSTVRLVPQGTVVSAAIDGVSVVLPALEKLVSRPTAGTYTIQGTVTGANGTGTCSTTLIVTDAPAAPCRFLNQNFQENFATPWGDVLPISSGPQRFYHYTGRLYPQMKWEYMGQPYNGPVEFAPNQGICPPNQICMVGINHAYTNRGEAPLQGVLWVSFGPANNANCTAQAIAVRPSGGCFAEGTHVMLASGELKPIEKLHQNDLLINPVSKTPMRIQKIYRGPEEKNLYEVRIAENRVKVTEGHPFLTIRGLLRTEELQPGDILVGTRQRILEVKELPVVPNQIVWNVEVENPLSEDEGSVILADGIATGDFRLQQKLYSKKKRMAVTK